MKAKRGETAEQTVNRWATELLGKSPTACNANDFDRALEAVEWLRRRLEVLKVHNT